ncbi:acyltransferase family protein [Granulicella cerasi]|uniref:Acyltransferase family protein n=1 Tax=Granulicella cerasi TaxID=741063 RepID=A0ABW1ZD55_9BACT|nr:acyltransferase [Granulicella cerasi]
MDNASAATSTTAIAPRKAHYVVLDGLRGVASIVVILFHLCEANNGGSRFKQIINHGYMAVDFFFMLSGFVIAYAYDDRWQRMTVGSFFKRRLIRLQPMVILASIIGALFFYFGAGTTFPHIAQTPVWMTLLIMFIGMTMIPVPTSMDIRGWQETYPLNGPQWSLFFEYIANILYAFGLRRASNRVLGLLTFVAALLLAHLAIFGVEGDVIGGWALATPQLHIGFARVLFPFFAGVLLMRIGKRIATPNAFAVSSILLVIALALPRFGGTSHLWINGLYEAVCIIVLFPIIVLIGASDQRADGSSIRIARFFGDLSYPLYVTHYPLIYLYTAWVVEKKPTLAHSVEVAALTFVAAMTIAYLCLKFFDEPVRRYLSRRFLATKTA